MSADVDAGVAGEKVVIASDDVEYCDDFCKKKRSENRPASKKETKAASLSKNNSRSHTLNSSFAMRSSMMLKVGESVCGGYLINPGNLSIKCRLTCKWI